jgi:hypothetical protein
MAVDPLANAGTLDLALAALRRSLVQERAVVEIVEKALEAQRAANAGNVTPTRGKVLDIKA